MNVMPKDVAAAGFDLAAWREELLALNPWTRGLTIDEDNVEFGDARRAATLARHADGKEAWNTWANGMLALRSALEAAGRWVAKRELGLGLLTGDNEATRTWLPLARAVFSTEAAPHRFEPTVKRRSESDVSFREFVFPTSAYFTCATFAGQAIFVRATFSGSCTFDRATFAHSALFVGATFSSAARFRNATFADSARFEGANFRAGADLNGARFNAAVDFEQAKFEGPTSFANGFFGRSANFEAVDSTAAFSLADATFRRVPSFIGATFKGTLRLDNVATPRYRLLGYTPDKDASARFRELRRRAVEAQDRDRELEFFAQEVRTGRFHAKGVPSWVPRIWGWRFWFGLAFEAFSDFGRKLLRPLLSWAVLLLGFATFFLGEHDDMRKARATLSAADAWSMLAAYAATTRDAWARPPPCRVEGREPFASTDALTEAIQLSLRNALVFDVGRPDSARRTYGCLFGLEKVGDQEYLRVPARVATASTLQALASGLLIFLFLLAVRNLLRLR